MNGIIIFQILAFVFICDISAFHQCFKSRNSFSRMLNGIVTETTPEISTTSKSFVQDELRPYAMKLHTRDQAPKEGKEKEQTPFTQWEPKRSDYLQFLVDSLEVYKTFDEITSSNPTLEPFKATGLERSSALIEDIKWMCTYDPSLTVPECGKSGKMYSSFLKQLSQDSLPKFMCHYYNHYFAHTAGGRMIGKKMSDKLLESKTLKFYEWDGDVKVLLDEVRHKFDILASTWNQDEKQACLEETMACFRYGGSLMTYMKAPVADGAKPSHH